MPFPYQRRPWDDPTQYDAPPDDYVSRVAQPPQPSQPPPYLPDMASGDPLMGGQGAAPVPAPMSMPAPPPVNLPAPQMAAPQAPPPPEKPGPPPIGEQEQALRTMVQAGPRKSTLGRIAAGAIGAAAGYVNAAGRSRVNVDPQRLDNIVNRNPMGKGSYSEGMARQTQLAQMEQADTARKTAWETQQVKNENERKQGGYYDAHAQSVTQDSATRAQAEKDKVETEKHKLDAAAKRQQVLLDSNKQAITIEEARKHNIYVSPEDIAAGNVIVDRKTFTPIAKEEAKPDKTNWGPNQWIHQKVTSKSGTPEYQEAVAAIEDHKSIYRAEHPVKAKTPDQDKEIVRKAKGYVGGLVQQYGEDWKKIEGAIAADKTIDDNLRSEALNYALKQKRSAREPKGKDDDLTALLAAYGRGKTPQATPPASPPATQQPGPPIVDPLNIRPRP